ncbi:dTDP-4-dehydrorhamnose reductase [Gordonia insulae]|uniref:dTDP-4-dehydrorhamnose reductase n=2 Tax=Gordonia insulae TaxID=2420509 RepID=A0A3G8JI92_9ACTN|nr:dTDP-4-dehydrorhamnose reductase [Gordonia insulae]AZG44807.1 dTDP-4-dehydrorhamnose reductase [Gordonia insulae]
MASTTYIVGAGGQLGTALQSSAPAPAAVRPLTSAELDLTDASSVTDALTDLAPGDVVLNCAAYTNVDGAEADPDGAYAVNRDGPELLARATARVGAWLVHVSTDYVFAGAAATDTGPRRAEPYRADDATGVPETVYGASKLAGERVVMATDPTATVVRTAWVYTGRPESTDFVGTMRRLEAQRDEVTVVNDQTGSPTYAADLADALWELVSAGRSDTTGGAVLHATNAGSVTWYEVARAVFSEVGASPDRVLPCSTAEFPRPAPRPAYSVLSGDAWAAAGLTPLRDWRSALHAAVTDAGPAAG